MELFQFDNTQKLVSFLDVHMTHPLLDHLRNVGVYDATAVSKEKIRIFMKTNMIALVEDEIKKIPGDPMITNNPKLSASELQQRTQDIFQKMDHESEGVTLCKNFFASETNSGNITLEAVTNAGISNANLEEYYQFAKFKYDCGMYSESEEMLGKYLLITQPQTSTVLGALWGRLACRILQSKWDLALVDFHAVKDAIESRSISPLDQLRQRAWLMHWSLLVLFNQRDGADALYDFFSEKVYLQTLENLCPWLLRYYTCAALLSSNRPHIIRDVLNEIQSISYLHSDPLTQFVESLYDQFDLLSAQELAQKSSLILKNDYFLHDYSEKFLNQTRLLLCEVYCGINRRVEITTLSSILQLNETETEKWIAEMISGKSSELTLPISSNNSNNNNNAHNNTNNNNSNNTVGVGLDNLTTLGPSSFTSGIINGLVNARIDSEKKQVIIDPPSRAIHQRIIEKTKDLNIRCGILNGNLENLIHEQGDYIKIQQQMK